jgi:hypothetical protein
LTKVSAGYVAHELVDLEFLIADDALAEVADRYHSVAAEGWPCRKSI